MNNMRIPPCECDISLHARCLIGRSLCHFMVRIFFMAFGQAAIRRSDCDQSLYPTENLISKALGLSELSFSYCVRKCYSFEPRALVTFCLSAFVYFLSVCNDRKKIFFFVFVKAHKCLEGN